MPGGGRKKKRKEKLHIFVNKRKRTRKYSIDITGPSLFHLLLPFRALRRKKKIKFPNVTEHERL